MIENELVHIPDGALTSKDGRQIVADLLGLPIPCNGSDLPELVLPKTLAYKSDGVTFEYRRPDDVAYLSELLSKSSGQVGVDYVTANRIIRLLLGRQEGLVVLVSVEHHPHNTTPSA